MKKLRYFLLGSLLAVLLAVPVFAAAHMSLSSSSSALKQGDLFTVYVSLSNDQAVGRGGIILSYDASVFEFIGGSCNVSGATLAEVSASRGGGGQKAFAAHTSGGAATAQAAEVCTLCAYEIAPKAAHEHTYEHNGPHSHECILCGTASPMQKSCSICGQTPFP